MIKNKFLIIVMIIFGLSSGQLLFGQLLIKNFFVGYGYFDSKLNDINSRISIYPINDSVGINTIRGFTDLNIGLSIGFQKIDKLSIEIAFDHLGNSDQYVDYKIFKEFSGFLIDDEGNLDFSPLFVKDTSYRYGFKLNTNIISINPKYEIFSKNKISTFLGLGLNLIKCNYKQDGIAFINDTIRIKTSASSKTYSDIRLSWQSDITISYILLKNLAVDLEVQYRNNKIKNIGGYDFLKYGFNSNQSENVLYPIAKTTIDYSGFNYLIRLRYNFKTKKASS